MFEPILHSQRPKDLHFNYLSFVVSFFILVAFVFVLNQCSTQSSHCDKQKWKLKEHLFFTNTIITFAEFFSPSKKKVNHKLQLCQTSFHVKRLKIRKEQLNDLKVNGKRWWLLLRRRLCKISITASVKRENCSVFFFVQKKKIFLFVKLSGMLYYICVVRWRKM